VLFFADADEEIIRLDIPVQEVSAVNEFNSLEHLVGQHQHCLEAELSFAIIQ
jgi:hypothetical protein